MKRLLFLLATGLLTVLFLVTFWEDTNREWTSYQRTFLKSLTKAERRGVRSGIHQVLATDLNRVDRCMTCHMAIQEPHLALAEEPFTVHPGTYLESHPPEKFGCTVCHGGQGLATEVQAAHGDVKHWEEPLLRGKLVQASCYKCHGDLDPIKDAVPDLVRGIALYQEFGCAGCHAVQGFGQSVSIDLSDIGEKSWQLLDFTFVEGEHTLSEWLYEHFREPRRITPGFRLAELPPGEEEVYPSFMPVGGLSEEDAWALTIYMLSLTEESLPAKYVTRKPPETPRFYRSRLGEGRAVFERYGCVGCHGVEGQGGRKNFNAMLGEEVPPLTYVKAYYTREELKELIRVGRQPVGSLDPNRPHAPLYMPPWEGRISEHELEMLAAYLFSLYPKVAQATTLGDGGVLEPSGDAVPRVE